MSILGQNIKHLSETYGLSLREISRRAGIPDAITSKTVRGLCNPRQGTVEKIAKVFNMDADTLQMTSLAAGTEDTLAKTKNPIGRADGTRCIDPEVLLDETRLQEAWHYVVAQAQEGGTPYVSMVMPTDDLSPVVPRGATLYLTVEEDPQHPLLGDCEYAVGITTLPANSSRVLVFGTPTFSLGQLTLKTCRGQTVTVTGVVAYVIGWTVFKPRGLVSSKHAW